MDYGGGRASSWLDHGPNAFLPSLAQGHQVLGHKTAFNFPYVNEINDSFYFTTLHTTPNLEVVSTYFSLIQHSEHTQVLLQISPCPAGKTTTTKKHLLLECFCNQIYQKPQKTQTSIICTLLQLRKRCQAGAVDAKITQLQLNIKPGRLLQSLSSSFGPPACSPETAPLSIEP